jgi:chemotaxis protein MotC
LRVRAIIAGLCGLTILAATTGCVLALDPARDFASDVRALMALQDAAARGDGKSAMLQKAMLLQIRETYGGKASPVPANPRNSSAMLAYVLSGGHPGLVSNYIASSEMEPGTAGLLEGAVLFMTGKPGEASGKLKNLDHRGFFPADAGRIAFVKAMLRPDEDPAKSELLEFTIHAMPGTLVAESASRRLALVAANTGQSAKFYRHMDRYLRRFENSLYASEFMAAFVDQVVRQYGQGGSLQPGQVEFLLNRLAQDRRRQAYLQIASSALKASKPSLVQFAARRAGRLSVPGSIEELRAHLYASAFDITSAERDAAVERLMAIDPSRLAGTDRILLQAALKVAEEIRKPAGLPALGTHPADGEADVNESVLRSEAALAAAEKILKRDGEP